MAVLALAAVAGAAPGIIERVAGGPGAGRALDIDLDARDLLVHDGSLYVADTQYHVVRRQDLATGESVVLAGTGRWGFDGDGGPAHRAIVMNPNALAVDEGGNVVFSDSGNDRVRRIDAQSGIITTVAGGGSATADGVPATSARLSLTWGSIAIDAGTLYIADGERVRRVDPATGIITTIAGGVSTGYAGDGGPAINARFNSPRDLLVDGDGNLLICDSRNNRVRRIDMATGIIETIVGTGTAGAAGDGGPATAAQLDWPFAISFDAAGNLHVLERGASRVRRVDAASGVITTVAGATSGPFFTNGWGQPAVGVRFDDLWTVAAGPGGDVYLGALRGHIGRIDGATGILSKVGGNGTDSFGGDGNPALGSQLYRPEAVVPDAHGNLYISDAGNRRIRRIDATTGLIDTFAGGGTTSVTSVGVLGRNANLTPHGLAVGPDGHVFVASDSGHAIVRIDPVSTVVTPLTLPTVIGGFAGDGGPVGQAQLRWPEALAFDAVGRLYVVDGGNYRIRRIDFESGIIVTVAGSSGPAAVQDGMPATGGRFDANALAFDHDGNLLVAQQSADRVRRIDGETGIVSTVVGGGSLQLSDGRLATEVEFDRPSGVAMDDAGNLYVSSSSFTDTIWRVDGGTGRLRRIAGDGSDGAGGDGGPAVFAGLLAPRSLFRWNDRLLVVDFGHDRIRAVSIVPGCGNGVLDGTEECDDGNGIDGDHCESDCTLPVCGNGIVDYDEECDEGAANGSPTSCCVECWFGYPGDLCRPAISACDVAETCTGTSGTCPTDVVEAAGTTCPDDGDPCTDGGVCNASAVCEHTPRPDTDDDGICDDLDDCMSGAAGFLARPIPRLVVKGGQPGASRDRIELAGTFELPPTWTFADLDPSITGARLMLRTPSGGVEIDVALAAGLRTAGLPRGWVRKNAGKLWTYSDRGVVKATIAGPADPSRHEVRLELSARNGVYALHAGEPLTVTIAFGSPGGGAMACGEGVFAADACRQAAGKLVCRP